MNRPTWQRLREFSTGLPSFGRLVREKREAKKTTIRGAAEAAGMTSIEWSNMEHGRIWPHSKYYPYLAKLLDTTPAVLKQTISRIQHEQDEWCKRYQDVVDWLKKASSNREADRTLVIR